MPTFKPSPEHIGRCEEHIAKMEAAFRAHYEKTGLIAKLEDGANPSDALETYTFAFGIMASIFRSAHALVVLGRNDLTVESVPIFRSLLDQIIALYSVRSLGVHAVHAYGKQLAHNYQKLLKASGDGFELGQDDREYISMFLDLANKLPVTKEGNAAENLIKTYQAAQQSGDDGKAVYQMWLHATPLSKPSMKLADMHINTVPEGKGYRVELHYETDPDGTVDPRLITSSIIPLALSAYAAIVHDTELEKSAEEFGMGAPRK